MSLLTRAYGATKLLLSANAPTLMVTGGVLAMGAGTVVACKKTLQVEEVLAKHTPDLDKIKQGESLQLESYDKEAAQSDRFRVYGRVGLDLVKLYAVPGTVFIAGGALVFGGHRILLRRNATLALAFTGLKKTFDAYRARVINQWGTEADQAFYGGYTMAENRDPETGEFTGGEHPVKDWDESSRDPYNRVFDEYSSRYWQNDLGINKMFIHNQQKFANIRLGQYGHLYLSEVYEALGFPESDVSRVVGWKVKHYPDGTKDIPEVNFGLDAPHTDDWKYSQENAIYLDFNCQGLIVGGKVQKALEQS